MNEMLTLCGYRIVIRYPIPRQPKWYDLPRRLGWRPQRFDYMIEKGQTYLDKINHIMYVRADDAPALMETIKRDDSLVLLQDPAA